MVDGPPRLAELLLNLAIKDAEAREGILGDLWEEYCEAAENRTHRHAARWYWWSVLRLVCRYAVQGRRRSGLSGAGARSIPDLGRAGGPGFGRDVAYALRAWGRNLGFTAAAVLTLGLGIGASATIFGVFNAVVLRPIPFPEPDRLVRLTQVTPQAMEFAVSVPDFADFRDFAVGVVDLATVRSEEVVLFDEDGGEKLSVGLTTSALFRVLQVSPALGRAFTTREGQPGADARVAILSNRLWAERFGADPDVVGRTLRLDDGVFVAVGVMPEGPEVLGGVDLWLPGGAEEAAFRGDRRNQVYGRLRPGVTLASAREEIGRIAVGLSETYQDTNQGWGVLIIPLTDFLVGSQVRLVTVTLLSAVGLLLLLIGANLSTLLMARTSARQREFGVRFALGAGRWGVVRLLLAESLVLGFGAGVIGIAVAYGLIPVVALQPELVPRMSEVAFDWRVIAFVALAATAEGLGVGLGSAVQAVRWKVHGALSETGTGSAGSARRFRDMLVVGQVSLAMTLLVAAGLLSKSFRQLQGVERGFQTDGLMAVEVQLSARHARPELPAVFEDVLARIRGIAGVHGVAGTDMRFFDLSPRYFAELGRVGTALEEFVNADWRVVSEDYFRTAQVPVLAGSVFDDAPPSDEARVIVSESLARMLWPAGDALGQQLQWDGPSGDVTRVIGIVGDVSDVHPGLPQVASAYVSLRSVPRRSLTLLLRTDAPPRDLSSAVRREVRRVDAGAVLAELRPLAERYADVVALDRFLPSFVAVVAAVAVILAGLGIYGLVSFTVARRRHEIGIRLALGGRPQSIVRMLFRRGTQLVAAGVLLGAVVALALARVLSALLFETHPGDPATYIAVGAFLAAVGLTATYIPSRRATEVDPMKVLPT